MLSFSRDTFHVNVRNAVTPTESTTFNVKVKKPSANGRPVRIGTPGVSVELTSLPSVTREAPGGRAPLSSVTVYGGVPPNENTLELNPAPAVDVSTGLDVISSG